MTEYVIIRQNNRFEIEFKAQDPHDPESGEISQVTHIHELTPYTMLLSSLGACTTIVLHTYAQNHQVGLQEVEIRLRYKRVFQEDCENCEEINRYEEKIDQELILMGDLSESERQKLYQISKHCSVHKLLEDGIEMTTKLIDNGGES